MKSRAARICVPLAIEIAFALVIGIIIVATDGGRYGLGAKAALERLATRYQTCDTYVGTMYEIAGDYGQGGALAPVHESETRTRVVAFKRPGKAAGYVEYLDGSTSLYVRSGERAEVLVDNVAMPFVLRDTPWVHAPPWRVGRAHRALESDDLIGAFAPQCDYVEIERRKGPNGKFYEVITGYRKRTRTDVWIDPADDHIHAVVRPGTDDSTSSTAVTELYKGCTFDEPLDDALFHLDGDAFGELKQWMAGRESAPTN